MTKKRKRPTAIAQIRRRESETPAPIDGRDIHAIAMAMVRIAELFERMVTPPAPRQGSELERYLKRYMSGRWIRRDGDNLAPPFNPERDLSPAQRLHDRHQGRGQDARPAVAKSAPGD